MIQMFGNKIKKSAIFAKKTDKQDWVAVQHERHVEQGWFREYVILKVSVNVFKIDKCVKAYCLLVEEKTQVTGREYMQCSIRPKKIWEEQVRADLQFLNVCCHDRI